jgi:4-hydroxybenzoate polyprenyltransferase
MAANDVADRALDAEERPERPIPSGRVSPRYAAGLAAGLTVAGLGFAAAGGRRSLTVALPLAGAIWAYDLALKGTRAGPLAMAACRGLDVLLGASTAPGGAIRRAVPPALLMALHTYTVTELSRREVHGGQSRTPAATLAGTAVVAGVAGAGGRDPVAAGLAGWYAVHYGQSQVAVAAQPSATRFRDAVRAGITAMPALQGALAARAGAPLAGLLVAAAAPIGRRLYRKLSPT